MPSIWIQEPLAPAEVTALHNEFPDYSYLISEPSEEQWDDVEVLFGSELGSEALALAHSLRWIHAPTTNLTGLCLKEIEETTNLLVTNTKNRDATRFAEYAMGAILASAKNFFPLHEVRHDPAALEANPFREFLWTLRDRTFIQVGLGQVGTAILEHAQQFHMRTWGISELASFHPFSEKTFKYGDLHSLLPAADIVSIAIPRGEAAPHLFGEQELELMKPDSILLAIGSRGAYDEEAVAKVASTGKFRAVILDAPINPHSPLWKIDDVWITPYIAPSPESGERLSFRQFQYNFRRYIRNEFDGLKNLVRGGVETL